MRALPNRGWGPIVHGLWDLWIHGGVSDPGMITNRLRVALALYTSPSKSAISRCGWVFHTVRGGVDAGDLGFRIRVLELYIYVGISESGMGPCRPRFALDLFSGPSQSAIGWRGWGFHTAEGGVDRGDLGFRSRAVGVVDAWRHFRSEDGTLPSPGGAGFVGAPANQRSADGAGVSTPCEAVLSRGIVSLPPLG